MAATPHILYYSGAGGTTVDVLAERVLWKRADNNTDDPNAAVPIPAPDGVNYSWVKFFKFAWSSAPPSSISNLRVFADPKPTTGYPSSEWDGITIYAGVTDTYVQAGTTDSTTLRSGLTADFDYWTKDNPLVINSGTVLSSPSTGVGTQGYLLTQMAVTSEANGGLLAERNIFYRYEEQ